LVEPNLMFELRVFGRVKWPRRERGGGDVLYWRAFGVFVVVEEGGTLGEGYFYWRVGAAP